MKDFNNQFSQVVPHLNVPHLNVFQREECGLSL